MKKLFFGLTGVLLMMLCCNRIENNSSGNKTKSQNVVSVFSGNWISRNYVDSVYKYGSPKKGNELPLEMVVSFAADSLCLFNFDGGNRVFAITDVTDSSFRVQNFNENEFTDFYLSENKKELAYEGNNNILFAFRWIEPKYAVQSIEGWKSAFEIYFNEITIAANYLLLNSENKPGTKVAFTSYGEVIGLAVYKNYKICYGGGCLNKSTGDIIKLSDGKTTDEFIWQWENGTLVFYSITNIGNTSGPAIYIKGPAIFHFIKNR